MSMGTGDRRCGATRVTSAIAQVRGGGLSLSWPSSLENPPPLMRSCRTARKSSSVRAENCRISHWFLVPCEACGHPSPATPELLAPCRRVRFGNVGLDGVIAEPVFEAPDAGDAAGAMRLRKACSVTATRRQPLSWLVALARSAPAASPPPAASPRASSFPASIVTVPSRRSTKTSAVTNPSQPAPAGRSLQDRPGASSQTAEVRAGRSQSTVTPAT